MNKENKNVLYSFNFNYKQYLKIFNIDSLITLNNYITTNMSSNISKITIMRIFKFGIYEYRKTVINYPDITNNIIEMNKSKQ